MSLFLIFVFIANMRSLLYYSVVCVLDVSALACFFYFTPLLLVTFPLLPVQNRKLLIIYHIRYKSAKGARMKASKKEDRGQTTEIIYYSYSYVETARPRETLSADAAAVSSYPMFHTHAQNYNHSTRIGFIALQSQSCV